jgi:ABC-type Mn2+/Zn2+ transport system permease subunit/Mn-dependent DtxR family transcriptional regulator
MTDALVMLAWKAPGALQTALLASLALGVVSGLLGTFVVLRRESLFGDALSHAVFPGIVAGFLLSGWLEEAGYPGGDRNPLLILACAMAAGMAGAFVVHLLEQTTRLKQDASLGIVLSVFFALGIGLYTIRQPAGVQGFFYGQTAAIDGRDLVLMLVTTLVVSLVVVVFRRPLLVASFDRGYAHNLGYPVPLLTLLFSGLLTMAVVVAMQAVGVILVSAMLITPAATAHLMTDRFPRMMALAVSFAVAAGVLGSVISSRVNGLPTGPVIALCATGLFAAAYLAAPRYGVVARLVHAARQRRRIGLENSMKDLYRLLERAGFPPEGIPLDDYRRERRLERAGAERELRRLERAGELIRANGEGLMLRLSDEGMAEGARIVRNHRLWELYLTNEAAYQADHVHDDAEIVEHLLGEEAIRRLEEELGFPQTDPHGRPIPTAVPEPRNPSPADP